MRKRLAFAVVFSLLVAAGMIHILSASPAVYESEPNDSAATANPLPANVMMTGIISPAGDLDFFAQPGVNPTWGYIALLDTVSGTTPLSASITALHNDGATALQSDSGSWTRGSGIALQSYADGGITHYLRIKAPAVTSYTLRYYNTIVATQPEAEPNNTRATGTPSSFTHAGVISPAGDVDCFAFHGRAGDHVLVAVNADGGDLDPVLDLIDPTDTPLKSADVSGAGGKEFVEYGPLASEGVYAYCVRDKAGGGGATYGYRAGIMRNGYLYFPGYVYNGTWLNPRPGNFARIGDLLKFQMAVTNATPITVPGQLNFSANYADTCLAFVSASPPAATSPGSVSWYGLKTNLVPGEVYSVSMTMQAIAGCTDVINGGLGLPYYLTGHGIQIPYRVFSTAAFMPLIVR
jgi:hypothetical protein